MMTDTVDPIAGTGFARGAAVYAKNRPGYPPAVNDWLRERLGIGPGSKVVEVGAGTGKFTALLVATGAEVTAIDPVPEMLAQLSAALPDVRTVVAPAAQLPLADQSVDAVVVATAFHWFSTAEVVAEFLRVLRPGGALGLIWNYRDTDVGWAGRLADLTNRHEGDAPRASQGGWKAVFPAPGFTPLQETVMRHEHRGPAEEVIVGRTLSTSFVAAMPDAEREALVAEIRAMIADTPELAGQADVAFPYITATYDCRRLD